MWNWNVLDLSTFNLKTLDRVFMALVTIVLERAWAALKCDQLPVVRTLYNGIGKSNFYENLDYNFDS